MMNSYTKKTTAIFILFAVISITNVYPTFAQVENKIGSDRPALPVRVKVILPFKGYVFNKNTLEILADATVTLLDGSREVIGKKGSENDGTFYFEIEGGRDYKVLVQKPNYLADSARVFARNVIKSDTVYAVLYLEPLSKVSRTSEVMNIHSRVDMDTIHADTLSRWALMLPQDSSRILKNELPLHSDSSDPDHANNLLSLLALLGMAYFPRVSREHEGGLDCHPR